jgi:2-oxo-3-hexenedioate decarboxylase
MSQHPATAAIDHGRWAEELLAAVDERREVEAISRRIDSPLPIEDAYAIQAALLERLLGRGQQVVGAKLGLTSIAKQQQMNVDEPCYGWVLDHSLLPVVDGVASVAVDELIHPRVEPELVFVLAEDLAGPGVTADDVLDATARVVGGIEVIDSRYRAFSFTLPDVVADNTSAARVAIGTDGIEPRGVDLRDIECHFEIDGRVAGSATGAALLGDPAGCVAMLANHLGRHGLSLRAGWVIPAGAPTDAQPVSRGTTATARYSHLSTVSVRGV